MCVRTFHVHLNSSLPFCAALNFTTIPYFDFYSHFTNVCECVRAWTKSKSEKRLVSFCVCCNLWFFFHLLLLRRCRIIKFSPFWQERKEEDESTGKKSVKLVDSMCNVCTIKRPRTHKKSPKKNKQSEIIQRCNTIQFNERVDKKNCVCVN